MSRLGGQSAGHLVLIEPRWQRLGIQRTFGHRFPPMPLLVLAALARREGWSVEIVDENFEDVRLDGRASPVPTLVGVTVMTPSAPRAYEIATAFRLRGIPTVLGGVHASLVPNEALRFADAVVVGEAEAVFAEVLRDAAAGTLRPLYEGAWRAMSDVPRASEWAPFVARWPRWRYVPANTLQTTRGCRFNCGFCSVIRINGRGSRHLEVEHLVDDLATVARGRQRIGGFTYVFLLDDDLAADPEWTAQLCEAIIRAGIRISWGAQASIGLARERELLALAAKSGCRALFTGFESVSREALVECNKKNRPSLYRELVERMHGHGILVEGGFIFGFDVDTAGVFRHTVEAVDAIGVDAAHFSCLTPYPGTATFAQFHAEDRICTFDWSLYDLYTPVFEPARMSAEQLQAGIEFAYRAFYTRRRGWARFRRAFGCMPPGFALAAGLTNRNYWRAYRRMEPRRPSFQADPADIACLAQTSAVRAQDALSTAVRLTRPAGKAPPA